MLLRAGSRVKIVFDDDKPVEGKITKIIHDEGPAWPALYEINTGTDEKPELKYFYEYGNGYELHYGSEPCGSVGS